MIKLNKDQKKYVKQILTQIKENGVALLQLPTGQGKTLIALKVAAEWLYNSKRARPIVLVTRKRDRRELLSDALNGNSPKQNQNNPWVRDAIKAGGLSGLLHKKKKPKIGGVEWWNSSDLKNGKLPLGALVIVDEVHRFRAFLKKMANLSYQDNRGRPLPPSKKRRFLFLSATPINPVRITDEVKKEERSLQEQDKAEDNLIKNSYLDLYKTMIKLAILSRPKKDELLDNLIEGKRGSLEEFSQDLKEVMKDLVPVPNPDDLLKLGPKGKPAFRYNPELKPDIYKKTALGLLGLHQAIVQENNTLYCAERMALAGVKAKRVRPRSKRGTVSFLPLPKPFRIKGLFHHQPNTPYMVQTVRTLGVLDNNRKKIRENLSSKIDKLYNFLEYFWKNRSNSPKCIKWRVLVYCAHRGSVAALAAELERRFHDNKISCHCSAPTSAMYGDLGANRVVWATEGYAESKVRGKNPEEVLKKEFSPELGLKRNKARVHCDDQNSPCPRGFVLVTSDRLSESIDLHRECEIMVHFDLDWSPLHMIQRYGRLWRIDKPDKKRPKPPAVFHMIQPGSVDEEIAWRLEKRWGRLHALGIGLDIVKLKDALGVRIY